MEEFNLKLKTAFKVIGIICLFLFILFVGVSVPLIFVSSIWASMLGLLISFSVIMIIIEYYFVGFFKDYIDYFWNKQEGGVSEEQKESTNTIKEGNT